jgi:cell wall-associated NlpC family hydrolase
MRTDVDATTRQAALAYAESALDSAYVWGGNGPDGFDCSGLIVWAYQSATGAA